MSEQTPEAAIEEMMVDLEDLQDQQAELRGILDDDQDERLIEIGKLRKKREDDQDRIELLQAELRESKPVLYDDLDDVAKKLKRRESSIKSACHGLDPEKLTKGKKFRVGRISVSVSKVTTAVTFKTEALLEAHPELEEMFVDGDPVVVRTIDEAVLNRLISRSDVSEKDMHQYRVVTKAKNPSVRIAEVVDG